MNRAHIHDAESEPETDKHYFADLIRRNLAAVKALRQRTKATPIDAADRQQVRDWQSARWRLTFADLIASERYAPAAEFFFSHLYGPTDFDDHEPAVERVMPTMIAILPASGLETAALAIELDLVSETLDAAMVEALRNNDGLGAIDDIHYADAYRRCGLRPLRERQIELTTEIGEALDHLTRKPFLATALRLMRGPAKLAGLHGLHEFLESGFLAFRHAGGVQSFLDCFATRETEIMERIFAGSPDPFGNG